ncbi:MAG: DUF4338 domain-containing protein [Verrucomicrobia bacterium]|nr:DUF4338 domain-containing protein [Verrucomicrobiota bacterium]
MRSGSGVTAPDSSRTWPRARSCFGWDATTRQQRLHRLANNSRLLLAPWVQVPRLASHLLSRNHSISPSPGHPLK